MEETAVYLYGELAEKYGEKFNIVARSAAELVALMQANFETFRHDLINGYFAIVRGEDVNNYDANLTEEELSIQFKPGTWHIVPEAAGAGGFFNFIAGALLTVVGVVFQQPWLMQLGIGLMLTGVASMLTSVTDLSDYQRERDADERASIIYSGGVNNIEQGGPVPLVYGQVMAGSIVVASDVEVYEKASRPLSSDGTVTNFGE